MTVTERMVYAEYGRALIIRPADGEDTTALFDQICDEFDNTKIEQDSKGNVYIMAPVGGEPDASWVSKESLSMLSPGDRRKFLKLVPEFVIELKSPTDNISDLKDKMKNWMRNGVQLGWLIDPAKGQVFIYSKAATEPDVVTNVSSLRAGGPVNGFTLDLEPIWSGLADL